VELFLPSRSIIHALENTAQEKPAMRPQSTASARPAEQESPLEALILHLQSGSSEPIQGARTATLSSRQLKLLSSGIEDTGWLVHFTDYPFEIMAEGFRGVADVRLLGLTKSQGAKKVGSGFNFAYPALSKEALFQQRKGETANTLPYGEHAILFEAPHVLISHRADGDTQAIFSGSDFDASRAVVMSRTFNWVKWLLSDRQLSDPASRDAALALEEHYRPFGIPDDLREIKKQPSMWWSVLGQTSEATLFRGDYRQAVRWIQENKLILENDSAFRM
jgi:hypothetical protein